MTPRDKVGRFPNRDLKSYFKIFRFDTPAPRWGTGACCAEGPVVNF